MNLLQRSLLALIVPILITGCSTFEREWKAYEPAKRGKAQRQAPPVAKSPFDGRWEGHWSSTKHRTHHGYHHGKLRCIITQVDARHYRAHFSANWMFFTSNYVVTLEGRRRGDVLYLEGSHNLSKIVGGTYRYTGAISPKRFSASYKSSYDEGSFEMWRVGKHGSAENFFVPR
jgi:hypothetical protein